MKRLALLAAMARKHRHFSAQPQRRQTARAHDSLVIAAESSTQTRLLRACEPRTIESMRTTRQPPGSPRSSSSLARHSRFNPRPCELCYRPLGDDELRFCRSCQRKARRLGRT